MILLPRFHKRLVPVLLVGALFFFCIAIWAAVYIEESRSQRLIFAALDIGQGDALYVRAPSGVEVLIDGGKSGGALMRELPKVMRWGDRYIDAIIETHPDIDHMGGFVDVLDRYNVGAFVEPGIVKHNATTDALARKVANGHIPHYVARRGMTLDMGGGVSIEILFPDIEVSYFGERTNDGSIVARLVYGATSVMLTGDATTWTETHMLSALPAEVLASDLLKVGHHGSKYSTSEAFLSAVHPSLAVISVGASNSYGHPAQRVLALLAANKIPILRTDENGTLIFFSDGTRFMRK